MGLVEIGESGAVTTDTAVASTAPRATLAVGRHHAGVPVDAKQRRALALGAPVALEHGLFLDVLATGSRQGHVARLLSSEFGIASGREADEVCDWLARSGHRGTFDRAVEYADDGDFAWEGDARRAVAELQRLGVFRREFVTKCAAWDAVRLIHVSRCAFDLMLFDADEAWRWIAEAAVRVDDLYRSWDEFSANYLLAWRIWRPEDPLLYERVDDHNALLRDETSPWQREPW